MRWPARSEAVVPVAFVAIVVAVMLTQDGPPCAVATPCGPHALRWVALGALAAPVLMLGVHRRAAAVAACVCAVLWTVAFSGWITVPVWAYAAVVILVARRRRGRGEPTTARRRPHEPPTLPPVGRPALLLAAVILVVAAAVAAGAVWRQDRADSQQAHARLATGVVRAHQARELLVSMHDGRIRRVGSLAPANYPVGSAVYLLVDDDGLSQLRSEPYNVTPWLAVAVALAGLAAALVARVRRRRRGLRSFFAQPQPVRAVRVVDDVGYVHVLVPAADRRTAMEFGIDVAGAGPPPGREPVTVAATLFGEPEAGRWCAVEVGGRLRMPTAPIGATTTIAYDAEHAVPQEVTDDDEQVVDPGHLTADDRAAGPDEVREHRISPARAWPETLLIALGAALAGAEALSLVGRATGWPLVAAVAVGSGLGLEYGWRARIRPRLRWDVGGVASIGFRRRERQPWTEDSAALADGAGAVTLIAGDAVLTVEAPAPWPPWLRQRTAEELVAALRFAQRRAITAEQAPAPPEIPGSGRPALLYAVWVAAVALTALIG